MSDYIPKDPLNPNDPTNPNNPRNFDRYGNAKFEPVADDTGKGPYILLGLLVAIGLIGGLLYFNSSPNDGANVAQAPTRPAIERTVPAVPATPATPATPAPATTPANPAPAAPAGGTQ
jgi:hypothetical protein